MLRKYFKAYGEKKLTFRKKGLVVQNNFRKKRQKICERIFLFCKFYLERKIWIINFLLLFMWRNVFPCWRNFWLGKSFDIMEIRFQGLLEMNLYYKKFLKMRSLHSTPETVHIFFNIFPFTQQIFKNSKGVLYSH
jgi:hypothetical protein